MQELALDLTKIEENFPFDEFREGQKECVEAVLNAFNAGKRFVILEAPTGSGKSVIGMTVAKFFARSFYLTIQKILQDQLAKDFESPTIKSLKGRNAYDCDYWAKFEAKNKNDPVRMKRMEQDLKNPKIAETKMARRLPCSEGACMVISGRSKCELCFPKDEFGNKIPNCPYYMAVKEALSADTAIMNFHSFLYQTTVSGKFSPRDLLIIDEGHNSEPQLMNFVSLSITDKILQKEAGVTIPKLDHAEEYAQFFSSIKLHDILAEQIRYLRYSNKIKDAENWKQTLLQYKIFLDSVESGNWIPKYERKKAHNKVTLKPIFVDKHANDYLFNYAKRVLIMSATILSPNVMYDSLGIDPSEAYAYRMKNRFPVKNRPIYYSPCGSMSYREKAKTKPKMIKAVNDICQNYPDQRGIIHTHNFEIAEFLIEGCTPEVKRRFLFQKDYYNKDELLKEHTKQDNGIIIAPAMHEGLDLKGELSRFQIICKVPFPGLGDNDQLKARMALSPDYYDWLTALKLVQSYGRSIRSEEDYADTFILDANFGFFRKKAKKQLPVWFKEAIKD